MAMSKKSKRRLKRFVAGVFALAMIGFVLAPLMNLFL